MRSKQWRPRFAVGLLLGLSCGISAAKLPAPTPEQQQAAAAKKEQASAQQVKEKQQLTDSMDKVAERWRTRAGKEGWKTNPPTPVAVQSGAPAQGTPPAPGAQAAAQPGIQATAQPGASTTPAQPAVPAPPIRSEKFGTAPPSADVKTDTPSGTKLDERIYKNPIEGAPHKKPEK